jgi:Na+/proline symporter
MVFLSAWLRRSNATTGAEWMAFRFGNGRSANLSHIVVVIFALISCLGFLAYGFVGLGKFMQIFIPWDVVAPYIPFDIAPENVPHFYGVAFTLIAVFYTIVGGMLSIVWADVYQYLILALVTGIVVFIAMTNLSATPLLVPEGWHSPFFGWNLNLDWTGIIDDVNLKIDEDGFSLFTIFFIMMLFKGILSSLAGPAPNYDMQKILSTRSPKEASKMSGLVSLVLYPLRYLLVISFAVLGILFYQQLNLNATGRTDFEQILPAAINLFVPAGIKGLLLAGLLSAFLGTFAGTLNAAQAYIVNDIYLKYINPRASNKKVKAANYSTGILVVVVSISLGCMLTDVNTILQWIVSGLFGGYMAANILKWYWWRFNGSGFFWGMVAGIVPSLIMPLILPDALPLYYFPIILALSAAGCVIGTYAAPATDKKVLADFYTMIKPWGVWKPILNIVQTSDKDFQPNTNFKRDMFNVVVGIVWQIALVTMPVYFVLMNWTLLFVSIAIFIICCVLLKKYWYDTLEN